ncbi:MAG TPA: hypothetical protein VIJ51_14480 [Solirubrobacteraceae bacterium]
MPDLTGNTALDVALGLGFVYLLFSVFCSAVQEAIAGVLDLRARTLEKGLANLLDDRGEATSGAPIPVPPAAATPAVIQSAATSPGSLTDRVLAHGLIRTQYKASTVARRRRRGPSYLPPRTFAIALLDIVAPATPAEPDAPPAGAAIAADVSIPAGTKHALVALAQSAGDDRKRLQRLVEQWFDGAMARVSGWYTREARLIVCGLALVVTVGLNVNTIGIADRLVRDDALRAAVVAQATKVSVLPSAKPGEAVTAINGVQALGLPIGWNKSNADSARADLAHHFWRTVGGWLLTFLALSLGAPFWFDALGKLAGLRNTGPVPATPSGS